MKAIVRIPLRPIKHNLLNLYLSDQPIDQLSPQRLPLCRTCSSTRCCQRGRRQWRASCRRIWWSTSMLRSCSARSQTSHKPCTGSRPPSSQFGCVPLCCIHCFSGSTVNCCVDCEDARHLIFRLKGLRMTYQVRCQSAGDVALSALPSEQQSSSGRACVHHSGSYIMNVTSRASYPPFPEITLLSVCLEIQFLPDET